MESQLKNFIKPVVAAFAAWATLAAIEFTLLFVVLRVLARVMGPELLPSLKVVLDMGALMACGWVAGRLGSPRTIAAAWITIAGLCLYDFTPYVPLNVPWLLRLVANSFSDSRYLSSFLSTIAIHALMFGSLYGGAHLSRPRTSPIGLGIR